MRPTGLRIIACALLLCAGTALGQAEDRFIDNGDGTISDRKTGLMWELEIGKNIRYSERPLRRSRRSHVVTLSRKTAWPMIRTMLSSA